MGKVKVHLLDTPPPYTYFDGLLSVVTVPGSIVTEAGIGGWALLLGGGAKLLGVAATPCLLSLLISLHVSWSDSSDELSSSLGLPSIS